MNSKSTWRLFFAAVGLFAFIWFVERPRSRPAAAGNTRIFPNLAAANVTGLELQMSNLVIKAERTNDGWRLLRPFYPAESTPMDAFVKAIAALPKEDVISASEVAAQPGKLRDYGLEPPLAIVTLLQGTNRFLLHLGKATLFGDKAYAQVPGSGEVLVTETAIWKSIPESVNQWRSPLLLNLAGRPFDTIQIRAGQRTLEFARDETNLVWRINKPTPARANNQRVIELLQQLHTARVKQFVTDSPAADLERYGLQTPQVELVFALDTNRVTALEFGSSPTNDPASVYVRRVSTTNIVLVSKDLLDALNLPAKTYHDPRLISAEANQLTMIQVQSATPFSIAKQTNGVWAITEPNPMPADVGLVKAFMTNLLDMTIENFAKDVPTDADLKQFGLAPPQFSYSLYSMRTNASGLATNALLMQVDFGATTQEGLMYARRNDETPVYLSPDISYLLPTNSWKLRDRRLFDFAPTNVVAMIVSHDGQTHRTERAAQGWSADPIRNQVIDDFVARLGKTQARNWVAKGTKRMPELGFRRDGVMLEVEMIPGSPTAPAPIMFGKTAVRNNIYGATVLPGDVEPTLFEFPGDVYESLLNAFGNGPGAR